MGNKPDKKQIKSNIKQTQQIDRRLKAALDGAREELAQLRKAADQFLSARIQASLEAMDVEMLTQGKQKIRVSYLRSKICGAGNDCYEGSRQASLYGGMSCLCADQLVP